MKANVRHEGSESLSRVVALHRGSHMTLADCFVLSAPVASVSVELKVRPSIEERDYLAQTPTKTHRGAARAVSSRTHVFVGMPHSIPRRSKPDAACTPLLYIGTWSCSRSQDIFSLWMSIAAIEDRLEKRELPLKVSKSVVKSLG